MRFSITDRFRRDCDSAALFFAVDAPLQNEYPQLKSLLETFREQSVLIRSIVAVGCHESLGITGKERDSVSLAGNGNRAGIIRLLADADTGQPNFDRESIRGAAQSSGGESARTLGRLARQACELSAGVSGDDLLLMPAGQLSEMMPPLGDDLSFRAMAALLPKSSSKASEENSWKLRRTLFDHGLICIGSVLVAGNKALCFLASDAVRCLNNLDVESRGHITMTGITEYGAFGNQLFRYACVKFYALRHGLTPAFPDWQGRRLFGLEDKSCAGLNFPALTYGGFADNDREFWYMDEPPIDRDLSGYFQEIPECWRKHRPLLRRMFELVPELRQPIEDWHREMTAGGRRTLVAIHVRRGDYRNLQNKTVPWFRMVPEEWYVEWLRNIWPTLREPLLFVGTDEPDTIRPIFQEFETVSANSGSMPQALPDYVRDFEILRRAEYLAVCNSSFSRMAAILAPSTQKCFVPSFQNQVFEPYQPWIDTNFWRRFADSWRHANLRGTVTEQSLPAANATRGVTGPLETSIVFLDVLDLLLYLLNCTTISGIQRVQCEILRNLLLVAHSQPVRLSVLNRRGGLCTIETSGLLDIVDNIRAGCSSINAKARALLDGAVPCTVRPRDVLLVTGAFWNMPAMGRLLRDSKNSGAVIGVFIHDIMPIAAPEFFDFPGKTIFGKATFEALTFADFVLTTSKYNQATLAQHMCSAKLEPLPVHVVPLAHELPTPPIDSKMSKAVAGLMDADYVLSVGTLEVRKNPVYLFNIWKMLVASGRANIPRLVLVGRKGWLIQDFLDQLKACNYLAGKILVLHNISDGELDCLYRQCLLTMFPSLLEGWGLPVGESLSYGKICLCSDAGGIPEVGGELADYIDPHNPRDGFRVLLRYLDDPELRHAREREIARNFKPRSWRKVAEDFLESTRALSGARRPLEDGAGIVLPQGRYLSIRSGIPATLMDQLDGSLSADLMCISGWHPPENSGIRAAQPTATIRFRADTQVGTKINLTLKLAAYGRDFRVRICSGSGTETEVSIAAGSEKLAALSCVVEPGQLITARLLTIGVTLSEESVNSYWMLKGILYFDPKRCAGDALNKSNGRREPLDLASTPAPAPAVDPQGQASRCDRILLRQATMDESWRAPSFGEFLHNANCYWSDEFAADRKPPVFADQADERAFYSGCGNDAQLPQVGRATDWIRLIRRSNQFVSTARFSEGSVFDRLGVWKAWGYLQHSPAGKAPWLSNGSDGVWVNEESLKAAPLYEGSYLNFYNGNLHNYYHWLVEGLLTLDILSHALGADSTLKIALPKSVDINALLDHRESLRAIGLEGYQVVEVAASLIRVQEAVWVDSDSIVTMPAMYLKNFQQRVAALYRDTKNSRRRRRLLVARKGPTRKIHNLQQVQDLLSKYDFQTVYLEGMSMKDQILLFQSADFIVGPHGAGLSNLLFCKPGTRVIELMPLVEIRPFFWLISQKLDLMHAMQFCETTSGKDFQSTIIVDVGKLQRLINNVGAPL